MGGEWGLSIALDFFFGGIAVGSFLLSVIIVFFFKDEAGKLSRLTAYISASCMIIAMVLLFLHLGHPFRFFWVLVKFNVTSAVAWGTVFQLGFLVCSLLYALTFLAENESLKKTSGLLGKLAEPQARHRLAMVGVPFACLTGINHGFLLLTFESIPLWNTGAILLMTVTSIVATAIAFVIMIVVFRDELSENLNLLKVPRVILTGALIAQAFNIVLWIIALTNGTVEDKTAVLALLQDRVFSFWFVSIGIGLLLPSYLSIRDGLRYKQTGEHQFAAPLLSSLCILVGGFYLRYIILIAGQKVF